MEESCTLAPIEIATSWSWSYSVRVSRTCSTNAVEGFPLKTTLQLADQLLERAETLHENHLIHRDIKPANFVVSPGDTAAMVFCIDFGLSKRYRHPHTLQHIPYREGRSLTGTPRYASVANHQGVETSRRDDLESIDTS